MLKKPYAIYLKEEHLSQPQAKTAKLLFTYQRNIIIYTQHVYYSMLGRK